MKLILALLALTLVACDKKVEAPEEPINQAVTIPMTIKQPKEAWVKCVYPNCIKKAGFEIFIDINSSQNRYSLFNPEGKLVTKDDSLYFVKMIADDDIEDRALFKIDASFKHDEKTNCYGFSSGYYRCLHYSKDGKTLESVVFNTNGLISEGYEGYKVETSQLGYFGPHK